MQAGQVRDSLMGIPYPNSLSLCLLGGGSLSGLVCDLTVPKCVTSSIICDGWLCGEQDLFCSLWLPCTKSVRKENVKYQVFNKTKQYYRVKKIFTTGLDFEVSWFLTLKRCHLNKNLICL